MHNNTDSAKRGMRLSRFSDYFHGLLVVFVSIALLAAASSHEPRSFPVVKKRVLRIVSLSPSLTRQIVDLEAEEFLVGVSSYHPPLSRRIEVISSVVSPDVERIFMLRPDLVVLMSDDVIAYQTRGMESLGIPVRAFHPVKNYEDICSRFRELAALLGKRDVAEDKIRQYREILSKIKRAGDVRCAFFLSNDPPVVAGGKSFVHEIIKDAGGKNVFSDIEIAFPIVSIEQIVLRKPEMLITMVPDGAASLEKKIRESSGNSLQWSFKVKQVGDEHIPYYSPADYCASVALFADVLGEGRETK